MLLNPYTVELDADHPGFRDEEYRQRRDFIAKESEKYNGSIESIPVIVYTNKEKNVWRYAYSIIVDLAVEYAYSEHLEGLRELGIVAEEVPQLRYITEIMHRKTGFHMVPVKGLIPGKEFLRSFAEGFFYSTQYLRHHTVPGFTPEPDIIHDVLGHASGLYSQTISRIQKVIGQAATRTDDPDKLKQLDRIYWYVIEYGMIKEHGKIKTFGAGNLSSFIDIKRSVETTEDHLPFDISVIAKTDYDPTITQHKLFVGESFDSIYNEVKDYCNGLC